MHEDDRTSFEDSKAEIQVVEYDQPGGKYHIVGCIKLPPGVKTINSMLPIFDGKFLVCTHVDSTIIILNTSTSKFKIVKPSPFGNKEPII